MNGGLFLPMLFVLSYTDIDAAEIAGGDASTAWQLIIGIAAGVALIALALAAGAVVQRRGAVRDQSRKAELRAVAEATGAVSFTELDISDDADFDLPTNPRVESVPTDISIVEDIPEYL